MGADEHRERREYQVGDGCLLDQLIGQYLADVAGLGPLSRPANIRKTLESIYRYNYKRTLDDHDTVQRTYVLNDEPALMVCDYGKAERPHVPFPYYAEAWTGLEYLAAAAHDLRRHDARRRGSASRNVRAPLRWRAPQSVERARMRPPLRARHVELEHAAGRQRLPLSRRRAVRHHPGRAGLPLFLEHRHRLGHLPRHRGRRSPCTSITARSRCAPHLNGKKSTPNATMKEGEDLRL